MMQCLNVFSIFASYVEIGHSGDVH